MRVSKNILRKIIREEKRKILNEEVSLSKAPCPHATADALMASGMSAGEILGWVSNLVTDLSHAEVSVPGRTMPETPTFHRATTSSALESKFRNENSYENQTSSAHRRLTGLIPGYGFTRN